MPDAPGTFLRWGALVVPWSAAWSSEEPRDRCFIRWERLDGHRLRFFCDGIDTPGIGKPAFKKMHNERSRDLIRNRQCQICKAHLPRDAICMNQGEKEGPWPLINDGMPMCERCAALALAQCPGLQRAAAAGRLRIWRTSAWIYAPVVLGQVSPAHGGNPRLNELLARERGPVFSGIKLALTRFRCIGATELQEAA